MRLPQVIVLAAAACGSAFAWGCEGHQIVALIASNHLTEAARTGVYGLLKGSPIDAALTRFCQPVATDPMADAATWADDVKKSEKTGIWHYLDIPRGVEQAELMNYCQDIGPVPPDGKDRPGCLLTALRYELAVLTDGTRSDAERAVALRYIIHLVGDLHQPLHTTTNDDQGGNCTSVSIFDDPKRGNLHSAWDYGIIGHFLKQAGQSPDQLAKQIDARYRTRGDHWLHGKIDFEQWIWEGHYIAEKVTYGELRPRLPIAPAEHGPGCAAEREKTTAMKLTIGKKYAEAVKPVIDRQLAKGGYRLADVLNSAF